MTARTVKVVITEADLWAALAGQRATPRDPTLTFTATLSDPRIEALIAVAEAFMSREYDIAEVAAAIAAYRAIEKEGEG